MVLTFKKKYFAVPFLKMRRMRTLQIKRRLLLGLATLFMMMASSLSAQELKGAWEAVYPSQEGTLLRSVLIITDGFQVNAIYEKEGGAFVSTNGGKWRLNGNVLTETVEFNTDGGKLVGEEVSMSIELTQTELRIVGRETVWKRLDDGTPGDLFGAWLISGRMRNGVMQERDTNRPRKTMKILSGTRFQWIAYNTETKQFMGSGGGTYTTVKGKYTENIEFFSRDNNRVGASLQFDYALQDGKWKHSGKSSKGDPLNEVWSPRKK